MIAKHVPMRSLGKSDFAGLVNYVTDAQSKDHRLGQVQITNCDAVSVQDAITEVLATQHTNTRAKGDKTYHLIVSFRAGEQPSADTLRAIEERICAGLGYGEHQRVSAVHNDTDNLHIHIAINKIHPTRHTMHEPYYSHRALAELCTALERDYGLERDNHEPRQRGAEGRAADMERHAGVESLVGWIKRECLDEIKGAQSWQELHQVMRDNGLELRERANGLVIEAGDGTMVKASTLARDLSKPKLEARLGPFEASPKRQTRTKAKRQYQKDPIRLRVNTVELYARYKEAQQHLTATRAGALAEANRRKDRAVENVKKVAATKRAAIKHLTDGRLTKRLLYSQASAALRADLEAIHKRHDQERAAIYQAHSRRNWADWLKQQAQAGDGQALDALRAREAAQGLKGDTLQGEGVVKAGYALVIDNITKKGTIIYRAGSSAVRDDGERLAVSSEADRAGVLAALRMAMGRYGERITVSGSVAFKATAIRAAVDARLPIVFTDPILERRRLVEAAKAQARVRPGAPPVGRQPPPHRRHGLHTLGQLGGLYIEGGAQRPTQAPMPAKVRSSAPSRTGAARGAATGADGGQEGQTPRERQGAWSMTSAFTPWEVQCELHPRTPMLNRNGRALRCRSGRGTGTAIRRAVSVMAQRRQLPTRQPAGAVQPLITFQELDHEHVRLLAAKTALAAALAGSIIITPAQAGIPVIDGGNLVQNVMTAIESVAQTLKQIEQYQTQLQQYENMLQNTMAPAAYIWDQAQSTINGLMNAVNTLDYYRNQLGSLDAYLGKFQDVSYYRGSPCFSAAGCSDAERAAMEQNRRLASESQKKANDALFKGLEQQQRNLTADARQLERLQSAAQGANGQMQAIGFANQLAANQANQLLQIRGLLIAQQNAATARMQAQADLEAQQQAAGATSRESRIERTANPRNWLELTR